MLSLPDTPHQICLRIHTFRLAWPSKFLQHEWNPLWTAVPSPFTQQMFLWFKLINRLHWLSKFLRQSLMIFYHYYCLHLYCYFHNVTANMSSGLLQMFVKLGNLHGTLNDILYWIHGGTSVKYSCIVTHLQSGLNLQPPDDCLFRSLGNQCQ